MKIQNSSIRVENISLSLLQQYNNLDQLLFKLDRLKYSDRVHSNSSSYNFNLILNNSSHNVYSHSNNHSYHHQHSNNIVQNNYLRIPNCIMITSYKIHFNTTYHINTKESSQSKSSVELPSKYLSQCQNWISKLLAFATTLTSACESSGNISSHYPPQMINNISKAMEQLFDNSTNNINQNHLNANNNNNNDNNNNQGSNYYYIYLLDEIDFIPIEDINGIYPLKICYPSPNNSIIINSYLYQLLPYLRCTLKTIASSKGIIGILRALGYPLLSTVSSDILQQVQQVCGKVNSKYAKMEFMLLDNVIKTKYLSSGVKQNVITSSTNNNNSKNTNLFPRQEKLLEQKDQPSMVDNVTLSDVLRYYDPSDSYNGLIRVLGPHGSILWTTQLNAQSLQESQLQLEEEDLMVSIGSGTKTAPISASGNNGPTRGSIVQHKRASTRDLGADAHNNQRRHASTVLANVADDIILPHASLSDHDGDDSKDDLPPLSVIPVSATTTLLTTTSTNKRRLSARLNMNKVDIEDVADHVSIPIIIYVCITCLIFINQLFFRMCVL